MRPLDIVRWRLTVYTYPSPLILSNHPFRSLQLQVNRRAKRGDPRSLPRPAARDLPKRRYALFLGVTLALPLLLLVGIELALRLANPNGGLALFVRAPAVKGDYLVANGSVGERWFSGIDNHPTPAHELFAREKPNRAFRVFVMGESAAAGFPYPRNVEFSRCLLYTSDAA